MCICISYCVVPFLEILTVYFLQKYKKHICLNHLPISLDTFYIIFNDLSGVVTQS